MGATTKRLRLYAMERWYRTQLFKDLHGGFRLEQRGNLESGLPKYEMSYYCDLPMGSERTRALAEDTSKAMEIYKRLVRCGFATMLREGKVV